MTAKQALISVSDKTGIIELAQGLNQLGMSILSTGGTAKLLQDKGIPVTEVSDYTGFPEMLDGRVKTLHPKVHAGILARRDLPKHVQAMEQSSIPAIDLVVVNLYPFSQTVAKPDCNIEDAIENIDIGGPTMIRAAAKNYQHVTVVTDAEDYPSILAEMKANNSTISQAQRFTLAQKAFSHTAAYDSAISNYLTTIKEDQTRDQFPERLNINLTKAQSLRYGENPHQAAAFYRDLTPLEGSLSNYTQLQGKELSFNNIADTDTAWECVKSFDEPACVIIKHANPCGVAVADNPLTAYQMAFATDPTSAFGGIIAFNKELDADTAEAIVSRQFVEVIIAPKVSEAAAQIVSAKQNVRLLECGEWSGNATGHDIKRVNGGILVQDRDLGMVTQGDLKVVSKRQPTEQELKDLLFCWKVAKFVKSNAIVYARDGMTIGVGAGQMSRVYSAKIAGIKAADENLEVKGSVMASDAFFPFRDGIDAAAEAGITAVIQPGGSMRDEEVIAAADEAGMAMVFTGMRHFRH
mgnify:CR=1 FL=1